MPSRRELLWDSRSLSAGRCRSGLRCASFSTRRRSATSEPRLQLSSAGLGSAIASALGSESRSRPEAAVLTGSTRSCALSSMRCANSAPSHSSSRRWGVTAGQRPKGSCELVAHYGITEETMGCPLLSSMDTVHLGEVEGHVPVWFDRNAFEADAVFPVGRVKPHTDFRGPVESGLMKMIAIGLGKQKGAEFFHSQGMNEFHHLIPAVAKFTLSRVNIPFGVAVIENGYGNLAQAEAVPAARVWEREQELLRSRGSGWVACPESGSTS